jgi:CubicO group peptidase (beta-lactamase class C family)
MKYLITVLLFSFIIWHYGENAVKKCYRVYNGITLFDENKIVRNFRNMDKMGFPFDYTHYGRDVAKFNENSNFSLPESFCHNSKCHNVNDWLHKNWVTGLVVLKINKVTDATLLYERYFRGNNENSYVISWSVGKSIVSSLIGIAIQDGYIESVHDSVSKYVPSLKKSGYNGVSIKDVLQMSSGIKFNEDYADATSDINRMCARIALGMDINDYIISLKRKNVPGTVHNYISVDTQVLGMVLKSATQMPLTEFLRMKLWSLGGFDCGLFWLLDNENSRTELAFGTMNTCTRDYARFGWLYLNKGASPLNGKQIINSEWITQSITPNEQHLMPGINKQYPLGYGYQWWIPPSTDNKPYGKSVDSNIQGDYLAIGVYGQFIYVSPMHNVVIAMNSANPNYTNGGNTYGELLELETIELFRTIAEKSITK